MLKKSLVLVLFVSGILFTNNSIAQNELYTTLFSAFGEMPKSMSSDEINEKGKHGIALKQQQSILIEEFLMTNNVIVPIGKRIDGKNVILVYAIVEREKIGSAPLKIHIKTKTLNKKTGEILGSQSHLLDLGQNGDTFYDGSFKMVEDDLIEFTQHSKDAKGDTSRDVKQYKFDKKLSFEKNVD